MPARTARTSSTARPAALVEAIGTWETSCAPNAQQRTQTAPSAVTAAERPPAVTGRDPGQAKHRQGREDEHGDDEHRRAGHDQVRLLEPTESRSVSMPIPVYLQSAMGSNGRSKAV